MPSKRSIGRTCDPGRTSSGRVCGNSLQIKERKYDSVLMKAAHTQAEPLNGHATRLYEALGGRSLYYYSSATTRNIQYN